MSLGSKLSIVTPAESLGCTEGESVNGWVGGDGTTFCSRLSNVTPEFTLGCGDGGGEIKLGGCAMSSAKKLSNVTPVDALGFGVDERD